MQITDYKVQLLTIAAQELLDAIDRKYEAETQRKRESGLSPRIEQAMADLRAQVNSLKRELGE